MITIRIILGILVLVGVLGDYWKTERKDVSLIFSAVTFAAGFMLIVTLFWPEVAR